MENKSGVVLLSASDYSAYTLSLLTLLSSRNIKVSGVVIKKLSDKTRFLNEFRQTGFSIFNKIIKKIVLPHLSILSGYQDGFSAYYKNINGKIKTVSGFCSKHNIPILLVSDFHSVETLDFLSSICCELIIFTGGGIIRGPLMAKANLGILNCHMGILPKYRGMDCTYWAVLNGDFNNIGFTTHLMDSGIDTGPIIKTHFLETRTIRKISGIIREIEFQMTQATLDAAIHLLNGNANCSIQNTNEGTQHYSISPECIKLADRLFQVHLLSVDKK